MEEKRVRSSSFQQRVVQGVMWQEKWLEVNEEHIRHSDRKQVKTGWVIYSRTDERSGYRLAGGCGKQEMGCQGLTWKRVMQEKNQIGRKHVT